MATARLYTLTLTEALAYLSSSPDGAVWIEERPLKMSWWYRNDASTRHPSSGGSALTIQRTSAGFEVREVRVIPPAFDESVFDYSDNPGIELIGRMTMKVVELEVDRPR